MLQIAAQGAGTIDGIVGLVNDLGLGGVGQLDGQLLILQPLIQVGGHQVDDMGHVVPGQGLVEHDLVQTV